MGLFYLSWSTLLWWGLLVYFHGTLLAYAINAAAAIALGKSKRASVRKVSWEGKHQRTHFARSAPHRHRPYLHHALLGTPSTTTHHH